MLNYTPFILQIHYYFFLKFIQILKLNDFLLEPLLLFLFIIIVLILWYGIVNIL